MSDANDKLDPATDALGSGIGSPPVKTPAGPAASNPPSPTAANHGVDDDRGGGADVKGDSEAETVVLPGKEDATTSPQRRIIKHEGNDDGKPSGKRVSDIAAEKLKHTPEREAESKNRKTTKDHTATSSNLSSTRSSPAADPRATSRAGSESVHSKTKSHPDSDSVSRTSQSRKRKMASEDGDEKSHKRRQKRDGSLENAANGVSGDRDRREKTKSSNPRSESPQPRTRHRAQSLKGQGSNTTQKRGKPPPLFVGPRSKTHDDDSSEGSASPHSAAPHRRRLVSAGDGSATSPAKMPPHKKLRDKSGRTFLARACDSEDVDAVRARLQERPEDLDVADYAGNTPLQIASLSGRHEIVKTLLDAGCRTDCKNVDQDTPLIDAVENGHLEVIKLLLDAGLNPRQTNAKGEELMDLLDPEADDYEDIKKVLTKARESRRRTSDDHPSSHAGKESTTAHSPRESNMNSPPPLASASRRRTARGEATRNDLLWVNATRENLRNKARVGDDTAVNHILSMSPSVADVESVLAAARGSHELSLSLILAMGQPPANPDPDPIPGERASQSTPMLASIARGNLRVIELLLEQPGFNPTRRLYQGKAYHEIARERRGANWEEEYKLLKTAYDKFKGRSSTATSPSNPKKVKAEGSGSPSQERSRLKSDAKDALERKKSSGDSRRPQSRGDTRPDSPERSRQHTRKHLRIPSKPSSREQSIAVSDRELSPLPKHGEKKSRRSLSDPEGPDVEVQKPRKRLISKRDLNEGDRQRRASMVSVGSASSQDHIRRLAHEQSSQKVKREEKRDDVNSREDSKSSKAESSRKRSRPDTISPESAQRDTSSPDATKKTKRLRADVEGKLRRKPEGEASSLRHKSPSNNTAQAGSSSTKDHKATKQSIISSRKVSPSAASTADISTMKIKEEPDMPSSQLQKEAQDAVDAEMERKEQARKEAEKEKRERDEAERIAREEAAARAAEQLRREEAERKLKAEQEEAERKAKAEKEEAERKAREEEEARLEKKRQEEEQARKQAERERLRKEQEEMQARRRKEQEEKERLAREKKQQEEERRRREALPPALRIAAELTPDQAKQPAEVLHWLPLYTAESQQLEIPCDETSMHERWVTNLQAAPILGVTDLDLSQYTAWTKHPASDGQRFSLWRILRRKLARYQMPEFGPADHHEEFRLDAEAREKYDALKSVFWIRLSDLQDIMPRYPHLNGIDLKCCAMAIRPPPGSTSKANGTAPTTNGLPSSGMPNGYH